MHSSVGVSKARDPLAVKVSGIDLAVTPPSERQTAAVLFRRAIVLCEVIADLVTITSAVGLGYVIYDKLELGKHIYYPGKAVIAVALVFAIVMVLMLDRVGAYRRGNSLLRVRETEQVLRVSAGAFLMVLAVSFFTNFLFSRWLLVLCLILVPLLLFIQKNLVYSLIRTLHSRGYGNEKVLIYGSGYTGRRVFSVLRRSPKLGLEPVVFVDDDINKAGTVIFETGYERRSSAPISPGPLDRNLISRFGVDLVIIAIPSIRQEKFARTIDEALAANARISFVPSHLLPSDPWVDYRDIDGVLLASFGRSSRVGYEIIKRLCDFAGSLLLMVLGIPVFLLLALIIRLDSPGPILFRQERVGHNGQLFKMFKFRTMHTSAPAYDYSPRVSNDSRITGVGRFLRRSSLDELPQLLNVLQGKMSLVGPRPEMPFIAEQYTERQKQRLQVKPGLTGLWQLSGDRAFLIHENVEYDLYYIQHRNFFMDLAILLHTSIFAMRGV
ncbi:MAG TPA: sugar transferase [Terriglobales bacterium]|jgi:exopolysaccharide biosynthesis polyprenyl glycosylphosphotransferase|nr:sugar transferase [Terriglobales bacterium]